MKSFQEMLLLDYSLNNKHVFIKVDGNCMAPLIKDGETVEVYRCPNYVVGEIVLVFVSNSLRIHRVIQNKNGFIETKGDLALFQDPILPNELSKVLGKVYLSLRSSALMYKILARKLAAMIAFFSLVAGKYAKKKKIHKPLYCIEILIKGLNSIENIMYKKGT